MKDYWDSATLEKCVLELVLNSLKAKSTAVAVQIDVLNRKIQVVDNGLGIVKNALTDIGEYDVKGEESAALNETDRVMQGRSLVNIREISVVLIIMSRSQTSVKTYGKIFSYNRVPWMTPIENRRTGGTTVTVYFSRESCKLGNEIDSFAVRYVIVCLALVNAEVSFSVRDDSRGSILLRIGKHQKSRQLLRVICEQPVNSGQIHSIKIRVSDKVLIAGFWGLDCTHSRKIQRVLLNLRPVRCFELEQFMIRTLTRICCSSIEEESTSLDKIFFLLYIESPDSEYSLSVRNGQFAVEFDRIDRIVDSIKKSLRITRSKESKPSRVLIYQPLVPPLICRPIGRILGLQRKRTLLTNVARHSFENRTFRRKNEPRVIAEMKNTTGRCNEDVKSNRGEDQHVSRNRTRVEMSSVKDRIYDHPDGLRIDRKRIKKAKSDTGELLPITGRNSDRFIPVKKREYDNNDISLVNWKCIEKSRSDNGRPISQRRSLDAYPAVKTSERENPAESWMSQTIESSQSDTGEVASQRRNPDETLAAKVHERNNLGASRTSDKFIENLQDTVEPRQVSQRINRESTVKEYQYDNHGVLWISQKCIEKLSNSVEETYTMNECSQWSNWIYESDTINFNGVLQSEAAQPKMFKRFRFLPLNLHALLPFGDAKFISRDSPEDNGVITERFNLNFKHRRQDHEVRPCNRRSFEVRLKLESLQSMKVLNQVNHEFIVALTKQDNKKLLVVIDQHAMDERIRYENLLGAYRRDKKNQQFPFVTLHRPIIISDLSSSACNLLSANQPMLVRYGLHLAVRNENTLLIFTVPRCFSKKTYHADNTEIENVVRKLLQEVLDSLNSNGIVKFLPLTIHDAIASEACHGAIKFGDPLTVKQCEKLVSCWKETEAPNRCAHGRPSVIPLLELSSLKRNRRRLVPQEKLNFASLRNSLRSGNMSNGTARYNPYDGRTVQDFEKF